MENPYFEELRKLAQTRPELREKLWEIDKEALPHIKLTFFANVYTLHYQEKISYEPHIPGYWEWSWRYYKFE